MLDLYSQTWISLQSLSDKTCYVIKRVLSLPGVQMHTPLVSSGIVDSLSIVNLVLELERAFGISIAEGDVTPESFETPAQIALMAGQLLDQGHDEINRLREEGTFLEQLNREVSHARRHGTAVSIMAIRADLEDGLAAPLRRDFVRALLEIARSECRLEDLVVEAKYRNAPDDTVFVLLPKTAAAGAQSLGRRILAEAATHAFDPTPPFTASLGYATFPQHVADAPSLLNKVIQSLRTAMRGEPGSIVAPDSAADDPMVRAL